MTRLAFSGLADLRLQGLKSSKIHDKKPEQKSVQIDLSHNVEQTGHGSSLHCRGSPNLKWWVWGLGFRSGGFRLSGLGFIGFTDLNSGVKVGNASTDLGIKRSKPM